jgi:hypothetical protein
VYHPESAQPSEPAEVYEHVPWAELTSPSPAKKAWLVYLAAGAIAATSVGALVARSVGRAPDAPAATAVATTVTVPTVSSLPPSPTTTRSVVLSEADLLAATPGRSELAAAARSEWFVADYFSSGGDPASSPAVIDALPEGAHLPASAGPAAMTYVDWAASSSIEALGGERFRSTVLFRVLVAGDDGIYLRIPVQAVDVIVEVDPAGASRVVDLPMPVPIPTGPDPAAWEDPVDEVPEGISSAALRLASTWGGDPALVEAAERTGGWRVVVSVADEAGVRWPLALWLTEDGDRAPAS